MKGFKYKDAKGENGPVKVAQLKKSGGGVFQIKAAAKTVGGPLGVITVVPPNPGTDGCVRLEIGGGGDAYDVRFADGQVTNDGAKQFKVLNPVTEGTCPPPCGESAPTCRHLPRRDGLCGHAGGRVTIRMRLCPSPRLWGYRPPMRWELSSSFSSSSSSMLGRQRQRAVRRVRTDRGRVSVRLLLGSPYQVGARRHSYHDLRLAP